MAEFNAQELIAMGNLLASRLERLSADSRWAHKASGLRGSLLREIEAVEAATRQGYIPEPELLERLARTIEAGYVILIKAGREISVPDLRRG